MGLEKIVAKPIAQGVESVVSMIAKDTTPELTKSILKVASGGAKVYNEATEKILSKISKYLDVIPANSKIDKPIKINLEGNMAGFTVDRTLSGNRTKVVLKDMLEDGADFSERIPKQSSLQIILDNNGQMVNGDLCTHLGFGITDHVVFERTGKNVRRMVLDGTSYMPVARTEHWVPVTKTQTTHASLRDNRGYLWSDAGRQNNLLPTLQRSTFGEFLLHMAGLKSAL